MYLLGPPAWGSLKVYVFMYLCSIWVPNDFSLWLIYKIQPGSALACVSPRYTEGRDWHKTGMEENGVLQNISTGLQKHKKEKTRMHWESAQGKTALETKRCSLPGQWSKDTAIFMQGQEWSCSKCRCSVTQILGNKAQRKHQGAVWPSVT